MVFVCNLVSCVWCLCVTVELCVCGGIFIVNWWCTVSDIIYDYYCLADYFW